MRCTDHCCRCSHVRGLHTSSLFSVHNMPTRPLRSREPPPSIKSKGRPCDHIGTRSQLLRSPHSGRPPRNTSGRARRDMCMGYVRICFSLESPFLLFSFSDFGSGCHEQLIARASQFMHARLQTRLSRKHNLLFIACFMSIGIPVFQTTLCHCMDG